MYIVKANGEQEEFKAGKLRSSLKRAGAREKVISDIVSHIEGELEEGMTTNEIYSHAFRILKKEEHKPIAARYSLRRAIMELGPSGFPFESFLAELFRARGYKVATEVHLDGKCISGHEVDVVAHTDQELIVGEAKFHNKTGFKTDLKVALYISARAEDLRKSGFGGRKKEGQRASFWLITNTKFTKNAIQYGECAGLRLLGWAYPRERGLEQWIEETALHPLTCLTTLSKVQKKALFDRNTVLCRSIKENTTPLESIGLSAKKIGEVQGEAHKLCVKRV